MHDTINTVGTLSIVLKNNLGEVKDSRELNNLVVTVGKNWIASRMASNASVVISHMAIGTGGVAPIVGDIALGSETVRVAVASMSATNNVVSVSAHYGTGVGTAALTEAGLFNAATLGTMVSRTTFAVVNKLAGDTLDISWNLTVN